MECFPVRATYGGVSRNHATVDDILPYAGPKAWQYGQRRAAGSESRSPGDLEDHITIVDRIR